MPAEPDMPSPNGPEAGAAKGSTQSGSTQSETRSELKSESLKSESAKRQPMPFEPKRKAPKQGKLSGEPGEKAAQQANKQTSRPTRQQSSKQSSNRQGNREGGIPDIVSRRMVKRIAWCSGVPTLLGMSTFVVSYLAVSNGFPLPTYAVLLVSLGWFGLGVLGVSYGVLSASWDEAAGSLLGWNEVQTNWARLTSEWKANSEAAKANRASKSSKKS